MGIEAELGFADVDAASHLLSDGPPDGLPPLPYLGGDSPGVEEAAGIVGAEAETSFLRLVAYDQLVVEEEVQLPVTAWDQAEGADVVGEPLQYLARYPSGPERVSSGYAVLDSDIELFDAAVVHHGAPPASQIGTWSKREAPDRADAIIPQAIGPLAAGRRDYSPNDGYDTNSCVRRLPAAGGPPTPRRKRVAGRARVFVAAPEGFGPGRQGLSQASVLVVEDEDNLLEALRYNLSREGYDVLTATDGEYGLARARSRAPDLIILDIMLPSLNGLEVCRIIRRESDVPVLMLTAKGEEADRVVGLELGADDYVVKPFSMRELLARVRALLRRPRAAHAQQKESINAGGLEIDLVGHSVTVLGKPVDLAPREFELLALFAKNEGRALTRDQILDGIWGHDYVGDSRTVDVHVRGLRKKIEADPNSPRLIVTLRGVGYRFGA